jgi:hypothetical protein
MEDEQMSDITDTMHLMTFYVTNGETGERTGMVQVTQRVARISSQTQVIVKEWPNLNDARSFHRTWHYNDRAKAVSFAMELLGFGPLVQVAEDDTGLDTGD